MRPDVQDEVAKIWPQIQTDNLNQLSDIDGYREEFYKLFGFAIDQVDYANDVDINVNIPSIHLEMAE